MPEQNVTRSYTSQIIQRTKLFLYLTKVLSRTPRGSHPDVFIQRLVAQGVPNNTSPAFRISNRTRLAFMTQVAILQHAAAFLTVKRAEHVSVMTRPQILRCSANFSFW
eukprot:GEMP01093285.1.p1 GENE.GEMP01093285.1~~GEMP01093285.1.p1  ORF type:complete len:108 (-),score=5.83 GEMP01093285.1:3-326(-)